LAEGAGIAGRHLLVVEDVVTSGGQIAMSVRALRDLGAIVDRALCVVDRQEGGHDNLAGLGVELHSLLTRMNLDQANGQH
jgi:orotate phosphoribosyltransferase